jgi:hypothetical protein
LVKERLQSAGILLADPVGLLDRGDPFGPRISQRLLMRGLERDLRVAEEEHLLLALGAERRLPEQEDGDVGRDQRQREPRRAGRRVDVPERDHDVRPSPTIEWTLSREPR